MKQLQIIRVTELPVMNMMAALMKGLNYPPSKEDVEKAKAKYIILASTLN